MCQLKEKKELSYNNKDIQIGDIIEVIINTKLGEMEFKINETFIGKYSIPLNIDLIPLIIIYSENNSFMLL